MGHAQPGTFMKHPLFELGFSRAVLPSAMNL